MPRIIPRLLKKIEEQAGHEKFFLPPVLRRTRAKKSLHRPLLPSPSYHPADYEQSILLKPGNPIAEKKAYVRHKTLPPRQLPVPQRLATGIDPPRRMNQSEFGWSANPYLRMLRSPFRKCIITGRHIPSDLLIRLVALRVSSARIRHKGDPSTMVPVLVPDGLLHPNFTRRQAGGAVYALCWRPIVQRMQKRFHHHPRVPGCVVSPQLDHQISHQLRLRIVQEFVLLAETLEKLAKKNPNGPVPGTLRRLSHHEWGQMKETGTAPYENAVAIIILPRVNRDTITKKRPVANISALPPIDEQRPDNLPPVSSLLPASADQPSHDDLPDILPTLKIPLYNGISCFPSRSQRHALRSTLLRILAAQYSFKGKRPQNKPSSGKKSKKPSNAFLLCSNEETATYSDPAAIALALWRLRMYEGEGWFK